MAPDPCDASVAGLPGYGARLAQAGPVGAMFEHGSVDDDSLGTARLAGGARSTTLCQRGQRAASRVSAAA